MVLLGEPRKKSPVTPPGIDPGTVRLVAQCLNHYATPGPWPVTRQPSQYRNSYATFISFNVVFMLVFYVSTSSLIDAALDFLLVPLLRMCGTCTFRPPLSVLNVKRMLYLVRGDSFTLTFFKYHCNSVCILLIIVSPKNLLGFEIHVQHIQNEQIF